MAGIIINNLANEQVLTDYFARRADPARRHPLWRVSKPHQFPGRLRRVPGRLWAGGQSVRCGDLGLLSGRRSNPLPRTKPMIAAAEGIVSGLDSHRTGRAGYVRHRRGRRASGAASAAGTGTRASTTGRKQESTLGATAQRSSNMATISGGASGAWSATATWVGGVLPGASDTAKPAGFIVAIDQNVTVTALDNTSTDGHFTIAVDKTITGTVTIWRAALPAVQPHFRRSHHCRRGHRWRDRRGLWREQRQYGHSGHYRRGHGRQRSHLLRGAERAVRALCAITGNCVPGSHATAYGVNNAATGSIYITGTAIGNRAPHPPPTTPPRGASPSRAQSQVAAPPAVAGVINTGAGTLTITGNVTGGGDTTAVGVRNVATGDSHHYRRCHGWHERHGLRCQQRRRGHSDHYGGSHGQRHRRGYLQHPGGYCDRHWGCDGWQRRGCPRHYERRYRCNRRRGQRHRRREHNRLRHYQRRGRHGHDYGRHCGRDQRHGLRCHQRRGRDSHDYGQLRRAAPNVSP